MACMRVTVIGCAGSFPGPDSPASCDLLPRPKDSWLVMDLGNGALGALQRHARSCSGVDAASASHLHADHCVDLGSDWVARQYASEGPGRPSRSTVRGGQRHGWRGSVARTWRWSWRASTSWTSRPGPSSIGPFRVTVDHMNHPVETFGFRVEHAGWNVTYSADTGESDALVPAGRGRGPAAMRGVVPRRTGQPGEPAPDRAPGGRVRGPGRGRAVGTHSPCAVERPGADAGRGGPDLPGSAVAGHLGAGAGARRRAIRRPIGCASCHDPTDDPSPNCGR